jgi:hypothetical protein
MNPIRAVVLGIVVVFSSAAFAADEAMRVIDLRDPEAYEQLRQSNPEHFAKIQEVIAGLREQPNRVEGDWLQMTVNARDVDLDRHIINTSHPPKQILQFTLDETRYLMYVVRSDLLGQPVPLVLK